jgi:hypothetical protein
MDYKVIHAERLCHDSARMLHFQFDDGRKEFQECDLTAGSVVWRHEEWPGIILMAYRKRYTCEVFVSEEREFSSLIEADRIFHDLWPCYYPVAYYFSDDEERKSFVNHLRGTTNIPDRIPLRPSPAGSNMSYEVQLIDDYFDRNILFVPKGGMIDSQLRSNWKRADAEHQYHALSALRILIAAIETYWSRRTSGRRAGFSNWSRKPDS